MHDRVEASGRKQLAKLIDIGQIPFDEIAAEHGVAMTLRQVVESSHLMPRGQ